MLLQSLHTHSLYDDGQDTLARMAQNAEAAGFDALASAGTARFRSQTIGRSTRAVWQIICARRAACRRTFAAAFPSTAGWSGTAARRCRSRSSII